VTYGSETWTLRKTDEISLVVFERKVLRKIYGPYKNINTGEWKIRKNKELKEFYQNPSGLWKTLPRDNSSGRDTLGVPKKESLLITVLEKISIYYVKCT